MPETLAKRATVRWACKAAFVIGATCSISSVAAGDSAAPPIGTAIANFRLADAHGKRHALDDYAGKVVVLAFLGTECPLAAKYAPRLRDLAADFEGQGVVFVGVDSNLQDSLTEIAAFARTYRIGFPLLKDNNNDVADRVGATRTPEVVVLDRRHVVCYRGRIDDQYGFTTVSGYVKPRLSERNLVDAISDLLQGKPVRRAQVAAQGCLIGRVAKRPPQGDITYCKHVARILQERCLECHRAGEAAPFVLSSYDDVLGWSEMIREVVSEGRMPPWFADPRFGHFSNDARLSAEEREQICTWVANGCPRGEERDLPEPRKFADGWRIGEPDQVIYMSETPFQVPAEGVLDYQHFTVDPGWTTDKWIQAAEIRPGNRAVVHHLRVDRDVENRQDGFPRDFIGQYGPGFLPNVCPKGIAMHVPANSKLVFELHYTPNGSPQTDRSMIGVCFADLRTVRKMLEHSVVYVDKKSFRIPAGEPNHKVTVSELFDRDMLLVSLLPHMHLRGKSFVYQAEFPDGTTETLLSVPEFDFNWQLEYFFKVPKLLPKGSKLSCTAVFDNSADNPANPDPRKDVKYDKQVFDEMMEGTYTCVTRDEDAACRALVALSLVQQATAKSAPDKPARPKK